MSVTKVINIEVNDGELNKLNSDLNKVDKSFNKVEGSTKKAGKSLKEVGDNGGAISTLDSLTGGLATRIRDAAEASKLFNGSLKATRAAIIATGIGALVVALGLVVAYWDDIVEFITQANKNLEEHRLLLVNQSNILDSNLKLNESQQKLLKAQGKSTDELVKKEKELVRAKIANLKAQLEINKAQLKGEKDRVREVTFFEKLSIGAKQYLGIGDLTEDVIKSVIGSPEEQKELAEREAAILGIQTEINNLEAGLLSGGDSASSERSKISGVGSPLSAEEQAEALSKKQEQFEQIFDLERLQQEQLNQLGKDGLDAILNDKKLANDIEIGQEKRKQKALTEQEQRAADERERINKLAAQAKVDIAQNTLALIGSIAEEGSAIGKAVAVAQATISGIQAVQNTFSTASNSPITTVFPAYPFIQAGLAGAFTAVQIQKILSTDPSGKGGVPTTSAAGGGGVAAPSFNVVGTSGTNQLAQTLGQDQNPIQAFVVGSNVTTQQELDRNIVQTATIG